MSSSLRTIVMGAPDRKWFISRLQRMVGGNVKTRKQSHSADKDTLLLLPSLPVPSSSHRIYSKIKGPVSLSEHKSIRPNKHDDSTFHWYLFGDLHYKMNKKCLNSIPIDDFIAQILQQTQQRYEAGEETDLIHLFLENPHVVARDRYKEIDFTQGYLFGDIMQRFGMCNNIDGRHLCQALYPKLRMHNVDIRPFLDVPYEQSIYGSIQRVTERLETLLNNRAKTVSESIGRPDLLPSDIGELKLFKTNMRRLITWQELYESRGNDIFTKDVLKMTTIEHAIRAIPERATISAIRRWIHKKLSQSIRGLQNLISFYRKHRSNKIWHNAVLLYTMMRFLLAVQSSITNSFVMWQDVYTLASLFRLQPGGMRAQTVIMYVGNTHAKNIRDFLNQEMSGSIHTIQSVHTTSSQCLNISRFKQPFFT